ncbi:MAG: hypothetical protein HY608_07510 [Planctomycetes bacterium]|nr:hypothetical protein [Planctomycetota bacterium]
MGALDERLRRLSKREKILGLCVLTSLLWMGWEWPDRGDERAPESPLAPLRAPEAPRPSARIPDIAGHELVWVEPQVPLEGMAPDPFVRREEIPTRRGPLELEGIYEDRDGRWALVSGEWVQVGNPLGAWRVRAIEPQCVEIEGAEGVRTLRLASGTGLDAPGGRGAR